MKRSFIQYFILMVVLAASFSCESTKENVRKEDAKIVKASSEQIPDWVLKKKQSKDYAYFVGMSQRLPDLKDAKRGSIEDATSQLVEYIGFRATAKVQSHKEFNDSDNISSFKQNVIQTLEGKGSANVSIDVEDIYYEQYSDNTYLIYSLIKFPESWVQKERKRLQKLVDDQRATSSQYLADANAAINSGEISKALDLSLNAFVISEKAAENSDIYDESKNQIRLLLSSLTLSLVSSPKYVYIEGGSEVIPVAVSSSKTGKAVAGIPLSAGEADSNAVVSSKKGPVTDDEGVAEFEVDHINSPEITNINIQAGVSMQKFEPVRKLDDEFYQELDKIQKSRTLSVSMTAVEQDKVVPTTLMVIDVERSGKKTVKNDKALKFQEVLSGKMADLGYNIVSAEIPNSKLSAGKEENQLKESILDHLRSKYPNIKRLLLGIRDVNPLGKIGEEIQFKTYNINSSGLQIVDMNFVLSLLDVKTGKVQKSITLSAKGQGLNIPQAAETAEQRISDKLDAELQKMK